MKVDRPMIYIVSQDRDGEVVGRIAADLRAAGHSVLLPLEGRPDLLRRCRVVVVALSPPDESEPRFTSEILTALELDVPLVPVVLSPCDLPVRLRGRVCADFGPSYDIALTELLLRIAAVLEGAPRSALPASPAVASHAVDVREGRGLDRLHAAASRWGVAGGALGGAMEFAIYAGDPRLGVFGPTLAETVVMGALTAGLLWTMAGAIGGRGRGARWLAAAVSAAVLFTWIAVGGTYADVLGAAVVIGWPLGGIVGAALGRFLVDEPSSPDPVPRALGPGEAARVDHTFSRSRT